MTILTIITVTRNGYNHIEDCIKSVPEKNNIQHILIDGKSNDGSYEIYKKYFPHKSNLTIISELYPDGIYGAINLGISIAKSGYILIVNGDDEFNFFEGLNELLYPIYELYIFKQGIIDSNSNQIGVVNYENLIMNPVNNIYKMPWAHGAMLVSKEYYDRVGLYDTSYKLSADLDWIQRANSIRSTIVKYNTGVISFFRIGGVSTTKYVGSIETFKINTKYCNSFVAFFLFFKSITIKLLANVIGWELFLKLKSKIGLQSGIWKYK